MYLENRIIPQKGEHHLKKLPFIVKLCNKQKEKMVNKEVAFWIYRKLLREFKELPLLRSYIKKEEGRRKKLKKNVILIFKGIPKYI